jgi:hypothetical protein
MVRNLVKQAAPRAAENANERFERKHVSLRRHPWIAGRRSRGGQHDAGIGPDAHLVLLGFIGFEFERLMLFAGNEHKLIRLYSL